MKKIINNFINRYLNFKFSKRAIFLGNVHFSRKSKIDLVDGSRKEDIVIGDRGRMYGRIISNNGGKVIIGDNVKIGFGSVIGSVNSIYIGDGSVLAHNIWIIDNNNHPVNPEDRKIVYNSPWDSEYRKWKYSVSKPIVIGKNVWVGSDVRISKGVTIGDNSVIASRSVVTKDVPDNSIAAGNPAKIVKTDIGEVPRLIHD